MNAPKVIRVYGKAKRANFQGETIEREEIIFVPSERGWFRTIETYDHFVYRRTRGTSGSTLMCTCGGIAGIFGWEAYRQFNLPNMGRIICCVSHMNQGQHADGSTG
jgi:hypothetical protein